MPDPCIIPNPNPGCHSSPPQLQGIRDVTKLAGDPTHKTPYAYYCVTPLQISYTRNAQREEWNGFWKCIRAPLRGISAPPNRLHWRTFSVGMTRDQWVLQASQECSQAWLGCRCKCKCSVMQCKPGLCLFTVSEVEPGLNRGRNRGGFCTPWQTGRQLLFRPPRARGASEPRAMRDFHMHEPGYQGAVGAQWPAACM